MRILAATVDLLDFSLSRQATLSADYTLTVDDTGSAFTMTAGVLTLPASPTEATSVWITGAALELTCAADFLLVSINGVQTTIPGGTSLTFSPISPAVSILHFQAIGGRWIILEH
jgi:hypothetical protein